MADTVTVHRPGFPGSQQVVSRKLFEVDLKAYGYVEGAEGAPIRAQVTPADDSDDERSARVGDALEAMAARLAAYEARETELVLREQAVEQARAELALDGTTDVTVPAATRPRRPRKRTPRTAPVAPAADPTPHQEDPSDG